MAIAIGRQMSVEEAHSRHLLAKYTKENDTVYLQLVPTPDQLEVPAGATLFSVKPFVIPDAMAFFLTVKAKQADNCVIF